MDSSTYDEIDIPRLWKTLQDSENPAESLEEMAQEMHGMVSPETVPQVVAERYPVPAAAGVLTLTHSIITKMLASNCTEDEFYERLWNFISKSQFLDTDDEREAAFLLSLLDPRLPYFQLNIVSMSDEDFQKKMAEHDDLVDQLQRLAFRGFSQKTEQGSAVLDLVLQLEEDEGRAVLMGLYLSFLSAQA